MSTETDPTSPANGETVARLSYRERVDAHCKACIYDPLARGTWREQVATCPSGDCSLHDVRPVPRDCMKGGRINPCRVAEIAAKLNRSTEAA